jgi:type II secretory ATPase GspE/PulE/Tfp pilus assembly ATPase PilB-like protein
VRDTENGFLEETAMADTPTAHEPYTRFNAERLRRSLNMPQASLEELAQALAKKLGVPYFDATSIAVEDVRVIRLIPENVARKYGLIPVSATAGVSVLVVMVNPLDVEAIDAVHTACGLEIRKAVGSEAAIFGAISKFYSQNAFVDQDMQELLDVEEDGVTIESSTDDDLKSQNESELNEVANEAPVVKFVNLVLMRALRDRASDIHFEPGEKEVRIRMRIDGRLQETPPPAKSMYDAIITRIKILSNMDISERRVPQDGRFKFRADNKVVDLRVNSLPEVHGEKIVMRILDQSSLAVELSDIGFEGKTLEDFKRILSLPNGIILVTGPTGSGKSTTLYGALGYVNQPDVNIQTVEEPVEYQVKGINQCAIRSNVGMTFASALRAILRQDPDIIMVGEIRDRETAEIAMRAALTGHLVLSTLHTNDATSSFSRLIDMGVADYLISSTVKLVLAQRLVRRLCPKCKQPVTPDPSDLRVIERLYPDASQWTFYKPVGCDNCRNIGYRGRAAVMEFLEVTQNIANLIKPEVSSNALRKVAIANGMPTLEFSGYRLIQLGITTFAEVMRVAPMDDLGVDPEAV